MLRSYARRDTFRYLFGDPNDDALLRLERQALSLVEGAPEEEILDCDVELFVSGVMVNIHAEPLVLGEPFQDRPEPVSVDVSQDFDYGFRGDRGSIEGRRYHIYYPVAGYINLVNRQPSSWFSVHPLGYVNDRNIVCEYELPGVDHGEKLKKRHEENFRMIEKYIINANKDLQNFLEHLPRKITEAIDTRQHKIIKSRESANALGIPVKERENDRKAGVLLSNKSSIIIPKARDAHEPVTPAEFDGILSVIESAGRSFERSPKMTNRWDENCFRDCLVLYLNQCYAKTGSVTGETFIKGGKSDVLIRHQDIDVFIGECKIWGGKAQIPEEIDQLFGRYITWSATKAALIYFNRGKNTTEAVEHLKSEVAKHSCHVKALPDKTPTHLRFKFHHPSDKKKLIDFAVLVFPVHGISLERF